MDFSLTTLFVVPNGTLASTGGTETLTAGQLGLFRPDWSFATAGNIAAAKWFIIAQGRNASETPQESKKSDKIDKNKIISWRKSLSEADYTGQVTDVTDFSVKCGQQFTLTIRAFSNYISAAFANGYTRSVTVPTPCCECDGDPCDVLDPEATVDDLILRLNNTGSAGGSSAANLTDFFTFSKVGTGASTKLRITAKALTVYGNPCDLSAYPYEYDRLYFRTFVYEGPETSADNLVSDACSTAATVTVIQRATYPKGTSEEIKQLERRFYSYQTDKFKQLYTDGSWNGSYTSNVVDGTFYDLYYIKFRAADLGNETAWQDGVVQDETVIVAFEAGEGSAFETVLVAALGAAENVTGTDITTTTTTSTTSTSTTSTTSTTTLIP